MGQASGTKAIWVRIQESWLVEIESRLEAADIPPASRGRTGGVSEWLRRLVARELGEMVPADPHEEARQQLTGQPNPHHPTRFGRPTGRLAARLERERRQASWSSSPS